MKWLRACALATLILSLNSVCFAQFLPNNHDLSEESLSRWMSSNHSMGLLMEAIDATLPTDDLYLAFESLPAQEQDFLINEILNDRELSEQAARVTRQHGWKSIGEFRRYGNRLGNAIAAYFVWQDMQELNDAQVELLKQTIDPVVLAVSQEDINFVAQHEKILSRYIQSYASEM